MAKVLYGVLFLALMAQLACSNPTPTMGATATPVLTATTELTAPPEPANTPTKAPTATPVQTPPPTATAIPPIPTATATPANGGTTARPPVTSISSDADREALAALYEAAGGSNWRSNENWLSSAEIGEWHGVATDANGLVTGLDLSSNNMRGEIPLELGNLANLTELNLGGNLLSGAMPSELGNLGNLTRLDLSWNDLTGDIPPELGNLANLKVLDLYANELSGAIPPELGSLSKLRNLNLGHNHLSGEIPSELGSLANLEELNLIVNQLAGALPPELGNLGNLVALDIAANELNGEIPPELGKLTRVEELKLGGNRLTGEIPSELGNLDWLLELGLSGNPLSGCIPDSLRIHYYLADELDLQFCAPSSAPSADAGEQAVADYLGPNTEYLDPVLATLLYAQAAGEAPSTTVRVAIVYDLGISIEPTLEAYIQAGGGTFDGEDVWPMPIGLVPSVICRPDTIMAFLVEPDGTLSSDQRQKPYPNLNDVLTDVVVAHQGGMPENQAALYALFVRDNAVAVHVQVPDAETAGDIRAWLAERNIYAPPEPDSSGDSHSVGVLLPVNQILLLAQQFPDAYLQAEDFGGQGLPMLRSQWPPEALYFEKTLTQPLLNPDSDADQNERVKGTAPCSSG